MTARRRWVRRGARLLGPAVLLAILSRVDLAEIARSLGRVSLRHAALACVVVLLSVLIRTLRWRVILAAVGVRLPYRELLGYYGYSFFIGSVTPGRVGELVRTFPIVRAGADPGVALFTVLFDRLTDVAVLVIAATAALALGLGHRDDAGRAALVLVALGGLAAGVGWVLLRSKAKRFVAGLREGMRSMTAGVVAVCVGLTLAAWAVSYGANWLLSESLGLGVSYLWIVGVSAAASLVSLLPVTVLGAGTRDATLIVLLASQGIDATDALALSALFLLITLWSGLAWFPTALTAAGDLDWRAASAPEPVQDLLLVEPEASGHVGEEAGEDQQHGDA